MKNIARVMVVVSFAALLSVPAHAQTKTIQPPPKPADSGPSLAVTMQYIQDKLNNLGKISFVDSVTDTMNQGVGSHRVIFELSSVRANPADCTLKYHYNLTVDDGNPMWVDISAGVAGLENIQVEPYEQFLTKDNALQGHPEWVVTGTQPQTLAIRMNPSKKIDFWDEWYAFYFQDADQADRVAKAIVRAIELCGGGNKDPF